MRRLLMLRAIQAFEAAARKENYAEAAAELNVTPAAIGQQVRLLEAWLDAPLFRRLTKGSKRLQMTDSARAVLPEFTEGLDLLDSGLRRLRQQGRRSVITVSASQALVARWLIPRLDSFMLLHPAIDIRLDVSDRLVDIERGEADVGIRCGTGRWDGLYATELMNEEVFPVCSPMLITAGPPKNIDELVTLPRIHDLTLVQPEIFPSWSTWLSKFGCADARVSDGLKINASAAVIQAALAGQGVALARRRFIMEELRNNSLVRLLPDIVWPIAWGYFIVQPKHLSASPPVSNFINWLLAEAVLDGLSEKHLE